MAGYLKKSDADDTYATKDELNSVTPDTTGLLTEDDLEPYCTTDYVSGTYATKEDLEAKADASSLSAYATAEALNAKVDSATLTTKETEIKSWVEGKGYLTEHQSLEDYATKADLANIDTSVFLLVDELPEEDINVNKIYIYNNVQYRYVPEPEVEEGEEVPEGEYGWIAIGEANTQVDLTPYLKSTTAASTYATKASLANYAQASDLNDYVPVLSVYYPSGDIPYTPEGQ
jgi:predicted GNAT family acetyltransferase